MHYVLIVKKKLTKDLILKLFYINNVNLLNFTKYRFLYYDMFGQRTM
jgi:hypothetical protein